MLFADDQPNENISAAPRRSVPKWPFLFADAALVVVALAIWLSPGGLSTLQLGFCLATVGLGAVIFVVPYVLEYLSATGGNIFADRSFGSHFDGTVSTKESEWHRQARIATEAVEHAVRANAALESSARRFDARFAPLVEVHQNLAAVVTELREATAARAIAAEGDAQAIQREFERLRKEQAEKFKASEEKMAVLGDALAVLASQIKPYAPRPITDVNPAAVPTRVKGSSNVPRQEVSIVQIEKPILAGVAISPADGGSTTPTAVLEQPIAAAEMSPTLADSATELDKSDASSLGSITIATPEAETPAAINAETPEEKSMLAKALARAQSSSQTPAVAGIIMARARRPRKTRSPVPVVVAETEIATEAAPSPAGAPANPTEREGWQSLSEGKLDSLTSDETAVANESSGNIEVAPAPVKADEPGTGDTSSAFRRSVRAKVVALRGEEEAEARKNTPVVFAPSRTEISAPEPAEGLLQGELLAREADTIRKRRSSRSPVQACSLTAKVLIGIGNKPFVRGNGPGLSPDKGVPMEFIEIGQWRWVAPGAVKEPITLRILKNDETAAEGDPIILHPGQSLEVVPSFPD